MRNPGRDVPLNGDFGRREPLGRGENGSDRDEVVFVAMDQKHRRPLDRLSLQSSGVGQQAGIPQDPGEGPFTLRSDVERHHGALAEADERTSAVLKAVALQLRIEKAVELRPRRRYAPCEFMRIAHRQREPLPAQGRAGARLRRVRRNEEGMRQRTRPFPSDPEEVIAVRPVSVDEHDEASGRATGGGRQAWAVDHAHLAFRGPRRAR